MPSYRTHNQVVVFRTWSIGQGIIIIRPYGNYVLLLPSTSMYHLSPISPSPPTSFLNIQHHLLRDNASAATAVALKVSVLLLLQSTIVCSVPHSPPCLIVKYSLAMDTLHLYLLCFPSNISDNETLLESRPTD